MQTDTIKKPSFLIIAAQNEDSAKVKHQFAERATRTRLLLLIGYGRVDVGLTVDVNKALSLIHAGGDHSSFVDEVPVTAALPKS